MAQMKSGNFGLTCSKASGSSVIEVLKRSRPTYAVTVVQTDMGTRDARAALCDGPAFLVCEERLEHSSGDGEGRKEEEQKFHRDDGAEVVVVTWLLGCG